MKKIIVTAEIEVDDRRITRKYANFAANYETNRRGVPTTRGLKQFARRHLMTESGMRDFGFKSRITGVKIVESELSAGQSKISEGNS